MAHVYLSGPMTGLPEFNVPAFMAAALRLRTEGHEVFNPAESFGGRLDLPRDEYFRKDFEELVRVANNGGYVVVLPGWEKSRGATLEVLAAAEMGIRVMTLDGEPVAAPQHQVCQATQERMVSGEVRVTDPRTGGQKGQKPVAFDLLPWTALEEVAKLYRYGADKYQQPHNWRLGYKWSLSFAAMMRHAAAFWEGEDNDRDSQCPHLASVVFHALAMITYGKEKLGTDDRPGKLLEEMRKVPQSKSV